MIIQKLTTNLKIKVTPILLVLIISVLFIAGASRKTVVSPQRQTQPANVSNAAPIKREQTEWCNIWIPNATSNNLPRVLLIGDSITQGYYGAVSRRLAGKAYCARITTSASVCDPAFVLQLNCVLRQYHFDVIHFNNGLHGFGYTEQQYKQGYQKFVDYLRKVSGGAVLICANTTALKCDGKKAYLNPRVNKRNEIATEISRKYHIPIDDLHTMTVNHPENHRDDFHYRLKAINMQAKQVAKIILKYIPGQKN